METAPAAGRADRATQAALHAATARYYDDKVRRYGATPLGADWTCEPTQHMRFVQLLKVCDFSRGFSLNDIGCGYGALAAFLHGRHADCAIDYLGVDVSTQMLAAATRRWPQTPRVAFSRGSRGPRVADYSVASGIFNVRLDQPLASWEEMVAQTLADLHRTSRRGFAVNFLAPLEPTTMPRPQLYRAPATQWAGFCERSLGARTAVISGYGMREYTLHVRPTA